MLDLNCWIDVPALCVGPFLAINLTNRGADKKAHNDRLMQKRQTGDWPIPKVALAAGVEGKTVVLYYAEGGRTIVYTGRCTRKRTTGTTKNDQPRFALTVAQKWKIEGGADVTFTEFFSGFRMSSNPTTVWADTDTRLIPQDGREDDNDPDDDNKKGVGGGSSMVLLAQRLHHDLFVKRVQRVWGKKCALTGLAAPRLIQACHLVPWSIGEPLEQTSGHNGLMLCAHLHALLDSHLLSFDDDGRLMLAAGLDPALRKLVLVSGSTNLRRVPSAAQAQFLQLHRATAATRGQNLIRA